jgi:hypothetical protein
MSNVDRVLAEGRQAGYKSRFENAPAPRMVDAQVADHLRRSGGDHALAVIKGHAVLLNELGAQENALAEQIFGLERQCETLRGEQQRDIGQPHRDQFRHNPSIPPTSPEERERGARLVREYPDRLGAQLADATEQLNALRGRRDVMAARARPLGERWRRCTVRIRRAVTGAAGALSFVTPPNVAKLTLDAARQRIAQLHADAVEIVVAPRTSGEVKQMISAWAERNARAPSIERLFDPGNREIDPWETGPAPFISGQEVDGKWVADALGLALWAGGDQIIKRLHAEADLLADDKHALDAATRAKRLTECRAQLLAAMRAEEAVAWRLLGEGAPIVLRSIPGEGDAMWVNGPWPLSEAIGDHVRAILSIA